MSNGTMMIAWLRVARLFYRRFNDLGENEAYCQETLTPLLVMAVFVSFLEFFNAMIGLTRSKPHFVLLFAVARASVELLVAPGIPCSAWQHRMTALFWSIGDSIRFGCFVLDFMVPGGRVAKAVRYTVGPLVFPIGAAGEMLMMAELARFRQWPLVYVVAALWPVGFYPLMKQLLRQRQEFFARLGEAKVKAV